MKSPHSGVLARPHHALKSGFTLLEMLITLALLSLVILGLSSVLMTVAQTQSRVDVRFAQMDKERSSIDFLRQILGQISALRRTSAQPLPENANVHFFDGQEHSVAWLGVMPARWGMGGLTYFSLSLEKVLSGQDLVLEFAPWKGQLPAVHERTRYVIETSVEQMELSYQRASVNVDTWLAQWDVEQELPTAIELKLRTSQGVQWPKTVIAVYTPVLHHPRARGGAALGGH